MTHTPPSSGPRYPPAATLADQQRSQVRMDLPDAIITYFKDLVAELTGTFKNVQGEYFEGYRDAVDDCIIIAGKVRDYYVGTSV